MALPWGVACCYPSPPQKTGTSPQKSPLMAKQGQCNVGVTSGRVVLVAGDPPGCPCPGSAQTPALFFYSRGGEGLNISSPKFSPPPGSCLQRVGEGRIHPWMGSHLQIVPPANPHPPTLLVHLQGVRIPNLGSFGTVPERVQVGNETVTIRKPAFYLARNLAVVHNLMDDKDYLAGKVADCMVIFSEATPKSKNWVVLRVFWAMQ